MTSLLSETRLKRTSSVLCRLSMFLSVALYLLSPVLASPLQAVLSDTDGAPAGWLDPRAHGGRLLDVRIRYYHYHLQWLTVTW